jgi:hypothetical protein
MKAAHGFVYLSVVVATAGAAKGARADETDACISASEKAVSQQKAEKLIDERASLSICAASSCPEAISSSCQQRLAQVKQAIPSIVFYAKDGSGHDIAAVKVTIDGAPYSDHLDGSAIVLDPGVHEVLFEAEGQPPVVQRYVLHANEQNRRETLTIGTAPVSVAVVPMAATTAEAARPAEAGSTSGAGGGNAQRTIGLVVGGAGVAGLIAGAIFGGLSLSAHSSYEKDCGSNIGAPAGLCNPAGVSGESDAATKGTISTVAFIAGGVALAAGAGLFLFAPKGSSAPQVGVGPGSLWVQGRF